MKTTQVWTCPICRQEVRIPSGITVLSVSCDGAGKHKQVPMKLRPNYYAPPTKYTNA